MVLGFGFATSLATRCALQTAETIIRCTGRTAGRGARLVNRVSFARTSAPFVSEVDNNSHEQGVAVQRLAAQQRAKACTLGVTLPQLAVHEQAQRSSARSSVAGLPSMFTHSAASTAGMQKSGSEKVVDASGLIIAHKGDSGVGQYKAARPQVLSSMSKQRQFGRLKPHQTCCICQGQPVPHALAAAKQRIKKLERQVLRLSKTISHQGKKPKALWEEVRLQDKWVCREATTAEKAVGHASRSSATARVDHEDPASTSGSSEAAPSFIQSALHINATAGSLAQSARLPQTSGRARQLTYHVDSYQASALGRSSWEESGSSTRSHGWSAASCSTSLPGRQAAVRSRLDAPAISRFTDASGSQAAVRSRPGASAISRFTDASGSQAAVRSRPDASASSSFTAESSSAAGTASITSRVSSRISILGKALVGTVTGLRIPDARTRGSQGQRGGTWQASNVPELLLSTLGRTPVVGALAAVPIAAARFGVKALVTAAAGSRFSQTAQTEESALSVQACQEIIMARLSADKSSCLALVVQSPLAAAHGKADAARVAIMAGKFHDAVILCKEGLNMKPEDAYVRACLYHNRGLAYSCLGQPILTIGDCSMAHRLSPLLWQPVYHRYLAYDAIGATRDALKDLKMVKQLGHPISWEDMFYLRWSHRYKPHQIQSEQVLGVAGIARDERKGAARAAFKKLSLMYHPDKAATDQKEIAKQLYEYIRAAIDELG